MDRKSFLVLLVSMMLIMSWYRLVESHYPQKDQTGADGTNTVATVSTNADGIITTNAPTTVSVPSFTNPSTEVPLEGPGEPIVSAGPPVEEKLIELETELTTYVFTSLGGGIKTAALKNYPVHLCGKEGVDTNEVMTLNAGTGVPIGTLEIGTVLDHKTPFTLTKTNGMVVAEKIFPNGLAIVKEFRPSTNYLIDVTVRFENRSTNTGTALQLPEHYFNTGTAAPMNAKDNGMYIYLCWYDGSDEEWIKPSWFDNKTLGCIPGTPRDTYKAGKDHGAVDGIHWTAVMNQFFIVATIPSEPAPRLVTVRREVDFSEVFASDDAKRIKFPFAYQSGLGYPTARINPGKEGAIEHKYTIYIGPKEYKTFEKLSVEMENELDIVMDFNGFFGFFARALLRSMNGLHSWGLSYAWSIICITIIMKILFWPLTNASTKSMKRMSQLQPQMNEIKVKYKDNPQKMNQKTMEFMKENKVNPLGGCLPMLLQLPVFFGFFTMLRSAVELRGESFLWVCDLSSCDTVAVIGGFPINPLPILMGVTMFFQASLTPPSPGMDPAQQKIMKYLPMMFVVFLYNFSSALTLYWTVQNLLTIIQTKLTKIADIKKDGATGLVKGSGTGGTGGGRKKKKKNRPT